MSEVTKKIALGFNDAGELVGLSKSFLRNAANDPDPIRRLKTVRLGRRVLIREQDLRDWFERIASQDEPQDEPQAA